MQTNQLRAAFIDKYGRPPRLFRAPGRVNLIGEHTDYNDGWVLPCALQFAVYVAAAPRLDNKIRLASRNFAGELEFALTPDANGPDDWTKYARGVALTLLRRGHLIKGADILLESDVPAGAGLSSSAALEVAVAVALLSLSNLEVAKMDIAKIAQQAEHEFAGVKCGLMDQFAAALGQAGHALLLDCRTLAWTPVPLPETAQFVICNTKVRHNLAESEYNLRRADCEQAAQLLGYPALRDVTAEELTHRAVELPERLRRRARHIVTENARVQAAAQALRAGNLPELGRLMDASHRSMDEDFAISCDEINLMVNLARRQKGVHGARMTGGGFGGCTINLVEKSALANFVKNMAAQYQLATGLAPEIYVGQAADGAGEIVGT